MADPRANEPRYPCKICGRQFFKDSLDKHQGICAKNAKSKRKVFDSAKQRGGEGSDVSYRMIKQAQKKTIAPPKTNWRAKHEDFINTVRAARGVDRAIAAGGPLPPPPPPSINPDYIQCPYCQRRFNQQAADRHINFCKEQSRRVNNRPPPNAAAKAKQATRTQYQPPKPKVKASPGVTPASSGTRVGAGAAARPGVGAAAPRGRATGTYQALSVVGARGGYAKPSPYQPSALESPDFHHTTTPAFTTTATANSRYSGSRGRRGQPGERDKDRYSQNLNRFTYNQLRYADEIGGFEDEGEGGVCEGDSYLNKFLSERSGNVSDRSRHVSDRDQYMHNRDWPPESEDMYPSNGQAPYFMEHLSTSAPKRRTFAHSAQGHHRNGTTDSYRRIVSKVKAVSPQPSRFCHECGSQYPVASAKFCCECGVRRITST